MTKHGGDVYTKYYMPYSDRLYDFSSNINPLGMNEEIKKTIIDNIDEYEKYPDAQARELKEKIAHRYDLTSENIFCGNGAAEVIYRLCQAIRPKLALLLSPTFSEYEDALRVVDCEVRRYNLSEEDNFKLDEKFLSEINSEVDIIFICNPNNPTGELATGELLRRVILKAREKSAFVVVDECFMDFVSGNESYSVVDEIKNFDNLFILKAFTKMYSMAGIRLGYALSSNVSVVMRLHEVGQDWNVSTVAQKCGICAMNLVHIEKETREFVKTERDFLYLELDRLKVKCYISYANYILFYHEKENLARRLLEYGILIRDCSNYYNLGKNYYRIAVRTHEENVQLIKSLERVLGQME